jgi:broad specificity phosphatase PhoE
MIGQQDPFLSLEGKAQAQAMAAVLSGKAIEAAYASPLKRAEGSARIALKSLGPSAPELQTVPEFREISLGLWEGLESQAAEKNYPVEWQKRGIDKIGYPPPGGESLMDLSRRVWPAFRELALTWSSAMGIFIVAHRAVNWVILSGLLGISLEAAMEIPMAYGEIKELKLDGQYLRDDGNFLRS